MSSVDKLFRHGLVIYPHLYITWSCMNVFTRVHNKVCLFRPPFPTDAGRYHTLIPSQWSSSGNPVCLELRPQCTLECHWRNASVLLVVFQWSSSGFPVVFQCVPIMQINTGLPLGHHWVLASASVVPVASQCTCGSSGLPVCSNYVN